MNLSLKNASLEYENARLLKSLGGVIRERDQLREELKLALKKLGELQLKNYEYMFENTKYK